MTDNKIFVSIAVHESESVVLDQCLNYIFLADADAVVLHVNTDSSFDFVLFYRMCGMLDDCIRKKILLNPYRTIIERHSRFSSVVTNLHRAHILNFQYVVAAGFEFKYFALDASNSLLIRPGLKCKIDESHGNCVGQDLVKNNWFWYEDANHDKSLMHDVQTIRMSQHEGSCYQKKIFEEMIRLIADYEKRESYFSCSGCARPEYPREEILFPTYFGKCTNFNSVGSNYIKMPWEKNLNWSFDEVKELIVTDFKYFDDNYGIKRVNRNVDDSIRALVGIVYGYRSILNNILSAV